MKHATKAPIFRNCPYAEHFETHMGSDCRRCDMYERCVAKKARKVRERKKARARQLIGKTILMFIAIAVGALVVTKALSVNSQCISAEEPAIPYTEIKTTTTVSTVKSVTAVEIQPIEEREQENVEEITQQVPEEEDIVIMAVPTISAYQPGEVYYYVLSDVDKKDIEKLIYKEARGETYEGKVAVAAVVLNRFFSGDLRFNRESIHSVITQSGAFADISDVTQEMLDTVPDLKDAVEDACRGWDPTRVMFETGALFFYAPKEVVGYQKQIREGIQVLQIGNHNFHNDFND